MRGNKVCCGSQVVGAPNIEERRPSVLGDQRLFLTTKCVVSPRFVSTNCDAVVVKTVWVWCVSVNTLCGVCVTKKQVNNARALRPNFDVANVPRGTMSRWFVVPNYVAQNDFTVLTLFFLFTNREMHQNSCRRHRPRAIRVVFLQHSVDLHKQRTCNNQ